MFSSHGSSCATFRTAVALGFVATFSLLFAQYPDPNCEIVESVPVETALDNPDLRNTAEVWLEMIQHAQHTIDLEYFYMSNNTNSALDTILQALRGAVRSGVKLRVILDARMSRTYPESIAELRQIGAIVHLTDKFNRLGGVQHAKFMIVDTQLVFLGSQNFDWRALRHIHELGLKISDRRLAEQLLYLFESDWNDAPQQPAPPGLTKTNPKPDHLPLASGESITYWISASPLGELPSGFQWDETCLLDLVNQAHRSICVQLLSYSTTDKEGKYSIIDAALRQAAARGVKVKMLIADWATASRELADLQALAQIPNITIRLSTIPEFSGGYIPYARVEHCKYCVVDDSLTWLSTANWGRSYFYNSRNLGLVIADPIISRRFALIFKKSWDSPYAWDLNPNHNYPKKFYREKTPTD